MGVGGVASIRLPLPPRFATECLMGLLYHLDRAYTLALHGTEVEVSGPQPRMALEEVLNLAVQVLEEKNRKGVKVEMRLSGNDKKYLDDIRHALKLPKDASQIDMIKTMASDPLANYGEVRLPSGLKPEYYEYNRVPGYAGSESSRLARDEYPINVVVMSLAGYLLCKVGSAKLDRKLDRNQWVSVVMTPVITARGLTIDPDYRYTVYVDPLRRLIDDLLQRKRKGQLDGLFPETALALLLACTMGGAQFKLYAITEASGQKPATIFTAMQMDLRPLYEEMVKKLRLSDDQYREKIVKNIINIAKLSLDVKTQGVEKTLATRFSLLLYEVLSEARPPEEFVNAANREYLSLSLFRSGAKSEEDKKLKILVKSAVDIGQAIWYSLMKAETS